jgi:GT2 family glycosyltransferase
VRAQDAGKHRFEVVVVASGGPVIAAPEVGIDSLRVVVERRGGLSRARNAGAQAAQGRFLAYIDDDAIAEKSWLAEIISAFERDASVACIGGRIALELPARLPWWYHNSMAGFWSAFAPKEDALREVRRYEDLPYGANLGVRRSAWARIGGFDERLGRKGDGYEGGEDIDFCLRALGAGCKVCTLGAARVVHCIARHRLSLRHLWHTSRQAGHTLALLAPRPRPMAWLLTAAALALKALLPDLRISFGRRLNWFFRGALYLSAAASRRAGSRRPSRTHEATAVAAPG